MNDKPLANVTLRTALVALVGDARAARTRLFEKDLTKEKDEEALHDFRVALRRLRTLLRVARLVWGKKRLRRIEGELRHYAHATGALRDEEVLRETLASLELPDAARAELGGWLVRRANQTRNHHAAVEKLLLQGPSRRVEASPSPKHVRPLDRAFDKLVALLESDDVLRISTTTLGDRALLLAMKQVAARAEAGVEDVEGMHALRIGEKRLRYAAELFVASHGARAATLCKRAARMQKRLGELHDIDEALMKLKRARGLSKATRDAATSRLSTLRAAHARKLGPHLVKARRLVDLKQDDKHDDADAGEPSPDASST